MAYWFVVTEPRAPFGYYPAKFTAIKRAKQMDNGIFTLFAIAIIAL